jgi:hypothetical protein
MRSRNIKKIFLAAVIFMTAFFSNAQNVPQGFNYQTVVRDASGNRLVNQLTRIRFSFYSGSPAGTLQWQEESLAITDNYGLFRTIIGSGVNTGAGAALSFDQVNWSAAPMYLKLEADPAGGFAYTNMGTIQLFSVPYAFYSLSTNGNNTVGLPQFADVNLSGLASGKILKWNGAAWVPSDDVHSDTVSYAYSAYHSEYADTAFSAFSSTTPDTVMFAYNTLSSTYAGMSQNAASATNAVHSDTSTFAYAFPGSCWNRNGNAIGASPFYLGTDDSVDLNFRTNNSSRMKISSNGNLLVGAASNIADLNVLGNDGLVATGVFNSGFSTDLGTGTRLTWWPYKAAFRMGGIDIPAYGDSIGTYSIAAGRNHRVGKYSAAFGQDCAAGDYVFVAGRKCMATSIGAYPTGTGVALGDSSMSTGQRCVAIGRGNHSITATDVAIGQYNKASQAQSVALGYNCNADGNYATIIGYYGAANAKRSFVYADASSTAATMPSAHYQFIVRASGGIVFYSDSARTMGVTLAAGGGSWASVSDRNKKENFADVDAEQILLNIEKLKLREWNYRSQPRRIRHIGPMAQDFYALFGLGENNVSISTIDMDGVILLGIKALDKRFDKLEVLKDTAELKSKVQSLGNFDELNGRLDAIEAAMNHSK